VVNILEKKERSENILFGTITSVSSSTNKASVQLTTGNIIQCSFNPDEVQPYEGLSAVVALRRDFNEFFIIDVTANVVTPSTGAVFEVTSAVHQWNKKAQSLNNFTMFLTSSLGAFSFFPFSLEAMGFGIHNFSFYGAAYFSKIGDALFPQEAIHIDTDYKHFNFDLTLYKYKYVEVQVDIEAAKFVFGDWFTDFQALNRSLNSFSCDMETIDGEFPFISYTVDSDLVTASLTNYPILIRISSSCGSNFEDATQVFDEIGANYLKINVKVNDTPCYVEVQKWNAVEEEALLWVRVPTVSSSIDTEIIIEYSSSMEDNTTYVGLIGSTPARAVWDSNFVGVWHLDGTESGVNATDDSTSNEHNLTNTGSSDAAGLIGRCRSFSSDSTYLTVPTSTNFNLNSFTLQCLYKSSGTTVAYATLLEKAVFYDNRNFWCSFTQTTKYDWLRTSSGGAIDVDLNSGAKVVETGAWHSYCARLNGSTGYAYIDIDDTYHNSSSGHKAPDKNSQTFLIGKSTTVNRYFSGSIDEVRVSNISRSDAWVKADYYSFMDLLCSVTV